MTFGDHGEITALLLLDLSAAFDMIDHDLLLNRLTEWFDIDDVVLRWVLSYRNYPTPPPLQLQLNSLIIISTVHSCI